MNIDGIIIAKLKQRVRDAEAMLTSAKAALAVFDGTPTAAAGKPKRHRRTKVQMEAVKNPPVAAEKVPPPAPNRDVRFKVESPKPRGTPLSVAAGE